MLRCARQGMKIYDNRYTHLLTALIAKAFRIEYIPDHDMLGLIKRSSNARCRGGSGYEWLAVHR